MLTPAKIKNHHFEASGRNAYRADAVDRFFEEVSEGYEQMFRENGEMCKKISLLAERLEEYKKDEDNIRNALLTAQRMSEQIQREARERAEAILAEVEAKEQAENARINAQTSELMSKAAFQARTIVEEAQRQAEKIIYDATHESKEAAISARDWMIREEAALEMMKAEVSKFKKQILDAYQAQLALIEQIPELASKMVDKSNGVTEVPAAPEVVETPVVTEEFVAPEVVAEEAEITEETQEDAPAEEIGVEVLQQMITEAEDTDAEDEVEDDDDDDDDVFDDDAEIVIPSVDDESDTDTDYAGMVSFFSDDESSENDNAAGSESRREGAFKLDMANIPSYGEADEDDDDYIDELDDDDDDEDDDDIDLASKFKNFFKK